MRRITHLFIAFAAGLLANNASAQSLTFGAEIGLQTLNFGNSGKPDNKNSRQFFLGLKANGEITPGLGLSLGIEAWTDSATNRSGIDLRDAALTFTRDRFEAIMGYKIESWTVTEVAELADVVNQTDLRRDLTGATRMGQPMLRLAYLSDFGWFGAYYFPQSPRRPFAPAFGLEGIEPLYETRRKDREPGFALRYHHHIGDVELGAFLYRGLDKSPAPVIMSGSPRLFYPIITQSGLSLQAIVDATYLRAELLHTSGRPDRNGRIRGNISHSVEIEHQIFGVFNRDLDLSLLAAYTGNSLGRASPEILQNDLSFGAKLNWNNIGSTELSVLVTRDLTYGSTFAAFGFESRLRDNLKMEVKAIDYFNIDSRDVLAPLREGGHATMKLTLFF